MAAQAITKSKNLFDELPEVSGDHYIFRSLRRGRVTSEGTLIIPSLTIPNRAYVTDIETGLPRTMRLLKGVSTIWEDEQGAIDEGKVNGLRVELTFNDGIIRVPKTEKAKAAFMFFNDRCQNNPYRGQNHTPKYFLVNTIKDEVSELEKEQKSLKAKTLAMECKKEDMLYHIAYLGIATTNQYGDIKTEAGLRAEYVRYAGLYPDKFMESFKTEDLKYNYKLEQLEKSGKILIDREGLVATWDSGRPICTLPQKENPIKYLARFLFSPEGKDFKKRIDSM